MAHRNLLDALNIVLAGVDAVRNLRALYVLLATFSIAGLRGTWVYLAMRSSSN